MPEDDFDFAMDAVPPQPPDCIEHQKDGSMVAPKRGIHGVAKALHSEAKRQCNGEAGQQKLGAKAEAATGAGPKKNDCRVCSEPCQGKHPYCGAHRRAHDCIKDTAYANVKPKPKKKGRAAKKKKAGRRPKRGAAEHESSEKSSGSSIVYDPKTDEHNAYKQIFGKGGDGITQMKIIVDFCEAFPDGKEGKDSAGRNK